MSAPALGEVVLCCAVLISSVGCGPPKIDPPKVKPNARNLTLECPQHAVGAFDASRGLIAGQKLACTAHVADLAGIGLPNVAVTVLTEAGRAVTSGMTADDGSLAITYETSMPLPHDTDPLTFQWNVPNDATHTGQQLVPLWMDPGHWTVNPLGTLVSNNPAFDQNNLREPRRRDPLRRTPAGMMPVNNPRDNVVTLIAVVSGEEAFIDKNGNGTFDSDEEPGDLTEPFVDANDNATYDEDEQYVDVT